MNEKTIQVKVDEYGYMNVGDITIAKKKDSVDLFLKFYTGIQWIAFKNSYYEETMKLEFPNEFYTAMTSVPKYRIFDKYTKIGHIFPRESDNGWRYLALVIPKKNKKTMKKYNQLYYITNNIDHNYHVYKPTLILKKSNYQKYSQYKII